MSFYTNCPIVRRSREAFQQWVVIGGERQKVTFSKDILWLLESESVVQFMHGGELLMEGSRSNDHYGLLTSTDTTEGGLRVDEVVEQFSITRDSSLSVVVVTRVFERPVIETEETLRHNATRPATRKAQYEEVPDEWRQERTIEGEQEPRWSRLQPIELASDVVWSSKNDEESNVKLRDAFIEMWTRPAMSEHALA